MTFMKAYSVVVQFGDQEQHSFKLYSYYKQVISDYCKEAMVSLQPLAGEALSPGPRKDEGIGKREVLMLRTYSMPWRSFGTRGKGKEHDPGLLDAEGLSAGTLGKEVMILASQKQSFLFCLDSKCLETMVAQVNRERDGAEIDQDVMRRLVEMLCTVGDAGPKVVKQKDGMDKNAADRLLWQSQARGVYKVDFESKLLTTSSEYYRSKVAGWTAAYSCPQFLQEIQQRLDDEESRLSRYLDSTSEKELKTVVQKELILNTAKALVEMSTGAQAMLKNRRHDELKLMYRIFKREPTMLPHIITAMEPYIEERAKGVVEDQQMIDSPAVYTEKVLELKKEVDEMVASCFEGDTGFQKGRNRGLEAVLNKDTRCAKYLALFCDLQLKKGLKGRNEEEVQTLVNQVVSLFAHLKDKDIFLDIYKSALSRRLLNKLSISHDAEDCFITKLKVECGQQSIQKLASMFTDMALSDQLQDEYMKNTHRGSPGGVVHEVRVLQTNAWPEKADDAPIIPCAEMNTCITAYEAFYHAKHNGRKLRWIYNMGSVELKCHGLARPHLLVVSAYQCLCLVLFNQRQQVTLREICEATKLPEDECKRQVNDKFTNEKMKVAVSLIKKE
ncbi:culC, partial [Symbiodinium pilosum]